MEYFELLNGLEIPVIGFGTGIAKGISKHPKYLIKQLVKEQIKNILVPGFKENNRYPILLDYKKDKTLKKIVKIAATEGCELFDTARAYSYSEEYLGECLNLSNPTCREKFFVITKISNTDQRCGVKQGFEYSLNKLRTNYVDLLLMHWPQTDTYLATWKQMEDIYRSGRAKAIGVCNCHIHHLKKVMEIADIQPMVNELECHPLLQQWDVRAFCKQNNIQIIAHTPTAKMQPQIRNHSKLLEIAEKYNTGVSNIILRWHYQLGDISIPNTTSENHVRANLDIFNFALNEEEMNEIRLLDANERIWPNPDNCDFSKL